VGADVAAPRFALVTGAARGLGAALAAQLHARGFDTVGVVRAPLADAAQVRGVRYVTCDLASLASVEDVLAPLLAQAAARRPAQAVLFNNAATVEPAAVLAAVAPRDVERALAVNLAAPTLLAARFCAAFAGVPGDRRVVNVSSGAASSPIPGEGLYCMAKAGLEMLTQVLAAEHAASGIAIATLRPGIIDTGMQAFLRGQDERHVPSAGMFRGFHARGELVPAEDVARRALARLVDAPIESGRTYRYAEL
jgi:NAD(P)-dependent dehydrogenase (short-subunit alcohol dehydrogenase family)